MPHNFCRPITRDESGVITRQGGLISLAPHSLRGIPGATAQYRVIEVEEDPVRGWDGAFVVGHVVHEVDGRADGNPFLALLS